MESVCVAVAIVSTGCTVTESSSTILSAPPAPDEVRHAGLEMSFPEVHDRTNMVVAQRGSERIGYGIRQIRYVYPDGNYISNYTLAAVSRQLEYGRKVTYAGLAAGIDLEYHLEEDGVEQLVVLNQRELLPQKDSADRLEIAEDLDIGDLDVEIDGVTLQRPFAVGTTSPIFLKRDGRAIFRVPPPVVRDAAGQESMMEARFELRIGEDGTGVLLTKIPLNLLHDEGIQFPVAIDPAINGACTANDGPSACEDGNPCTTDSCAGDTCTHTPANDGDSCWGNGTCNNGVCTFTGGFPCTIDTDCNDDFRCTNETCVNNRCVSTNAPADTPCGPGTGFPPEPGMGNDGRCDGNGICVPAQAAGPDACNDGNPCTDDSGTPGNCVHAPNDNNTCGGVACSGGFCDFGAQAPGCRPSQCDDGNRCTDDTCNAGGTCTNTAAALGTACADNSATCDPSGRCTHLVERISCDLEGQVRSVVVPGAPATTIAFVNNGMNPIYVFELSATGARMMPPTTVAPGATQELNTRAGVKFLVSNAPDADGMCDAIYEATFVHDKVVTGVCNTIAACGSDCQECPAAAPNGAYTCASTAEPAATSCNFSCNAGYSLNAGACDACTTTASCGSDCQACPANPANGSYACSGNTDPAATACQLTCDAGFVEQNGACVPESSCGAFGEDCCPGSACNAGFTCNAQNTCGCGTGFACGAGCCPFGDVCNNGTCEAPPQSACLTFDTTVRDGGVCPAAGCPRTCLDILTADPNAQSGVYMVDPSGSGTPFPARCDMDLDGGGWTLIGYEPRGAPNPRNFDGIMAVLASSNGSVQGMANGSAAGFNGPSYTFGTNYTSARLNWCDPTRPPLNRFQKFDTPEDLFADTRRDTFNTTIVLSGFTTNDSFLNSLVRNPDDARFCRASTTGPYRPGDTSWAIKGSLDNSFQCGCNSGGWRGVGSYYGGRRFCNRCSCFGGGWAGSVSNGQQKGSINRHHFYFFIR